LIQFRLAQPRCVGGGRPTPKHRRRRATREGILKGVADRPLAMFPLSTVLFPYERMPLHVFEPRYRRMVSDCLAADRGFGVVLITRGSEVGGGDVRVDVGTMAMIESAEELPDGRWYLVALGLGLVGVTAWLEDDPYPRAVVEDRATVNAGESDALRRAEAELRRVRAQLSELDHTPAVPEMFSFGTTPEERSWGLCAQAPVTAFDRQRLLEAPVALLRELVRAVGDDVGRILAGG
jgi:uncharacterized protein